VDGRYGFQIQTIAADPYSIISTHGQHGGWVEESEFLAAKYSL
jgi:hypothetical protein